MVGEKLGYSIVSQNCKDLFKMLLITEENVADIFETHGSWCLQLKSVV